MALVVLNKDENFQIGPIHEQNHRRSFKKSAIVNFSHEHATSA